MLTPQQNRNPTSSQGFTLIEMMVAMALGLIVVAAVLAFIFSLIRANSATVLDTRLNQEVRATMAVVAGEIRRARAIKDPIAAVGRGVGAIDYDLDGDVDAADATVPQILIENSSSCVRYAYYDGGALVFRAIYLGADGRVGLDSGSTQGDATCGGGSPLNAGKGVNFTSLVFAYVPATNKRRFSIELTGRLANPPAYMTQNTSMGIGVKKFRQVVSIRSNDA
jgi:prepilin-type N-terminal cleavage/methylation domain-containing protein